MMTIPWHDIDTVLLDMDGTLLDLSFDNWFWQQHLPAVYAKDRQLAPAEATALITQHSNTHFGTLKWYSLDFWTDLLGLDIATIKQAASNRIALRPRTLEFLAWLKQAPQTVILATNAHPATLEIKLAETGIGHFFDAMVTSHELQAAKEEQAFWQHLQQRHPFDPKRTLLIDDSARVLVSAERFGIAHLCGILQPDSSQPARIDTAPFGHINLLTDALP